MVRLRIGIDAHVVTGKFQGTRTTLTSLLRALARRGSDHDILIYTEDVEAARDLIGPSSFDYRVLGHQGPIKRLMLSFPRLLRDDAVDVAVFQYNAPPFGGARNLVFIHDILPMTHSRYFPWRNRLRVWLFFSLSILRAAKVLVVSDYTRRAVEQRFRLPPERVRTVFNGPSFALDHYAGVPQPTLPRYVLAVGRIEERKNVPLLVEAFRKAAVPDVRLVVVGARDLGFDYDFPDDPLIENRVGLSEPDLIGLYRGASLFVYPSSAEGFGLPLLDALLFGLPVISSNQTAMEEVAGGLADLFDPTASDAADWLAARIRAHFGEGPVVQAPDEAQREALGARFSWDRAANDLIAAIEEAAPRP